MKLLFDFLPIALFFIAYKFWGIYAATLVAILVSALQVAYFWYRHRRVEKMQMVTLVLIALLGSATLLFHDAMFIKWKPTAINWTFSLAFLISQFFGNKTLIERMLDSNVSLPAPVWQKLNLSWAIFFGIMGIVNLLVVYNFSTDAWVNFKLFGMLGLTIAFVILQAFYLAKYMEQPGGNPIK